VITDHQLVALVRAQSIITSAIAWHASWGSPSNALPWIEIPRNRLHFSHFPGRYQKQDHYNQKQLQTPQN
jgi:hypothetical protein